MTSLPISPQEAAQELLNRRHARRHLLHFTNYTYSAYKAEQAHRLLADTLTDVVNGDIRRLMIFAPPQHGKTELVSVRLPPFWLGNRPDDPVILTSYAASLAHNKSRQARAVVESPEYGALFPEIKTNRASRAVDHWELDGYRGGVLAAGVGGPITGFGGLLGIIDDPFENWAQAQSETIRNSVWEWWRSTFRTRIWENGAIVIVLTRWHEDDLAGRLLKAQPGEWHVLRLPAIAETQADRDANNKRLGLKVGLPDPLGRKPGQALCPGRFSKKALKEIERDVGSYVWGAQYQGSPRPPGGNRIKRAWLEIVQAAPAELDQIVRYWDKAATAGGGAFTAGVLIGRTGRLYTVLSVVRGQWSTGTREATIKQIAQLDRQRYGPKVSTWIEQEPGSSGVDSAKATIQNLAGFAIFAERATGSKEIRAGPFIAQAEGGNVRLLEGEWNEDYIEELVAFPNSTYKDQMDGTSGAFNKIALRRPVEVAVVDLW